MSDTGMHASESELLLRRSGQLGAVFVASTIMYQVVLFWIEPAEPAGPEFMQISWIMIFLMPVEILLILVFYRVFRKSPNTQSFMGRIVLLYVMGIAPGIYGFVIGFGNPVLRPLGRMLGLSFSLLGLGIALVLRSNLIGTEFE